jgi:hypothetical protein
MAEGWLNSLAIINIERAVTNGIMENEIDAIIDIFGRRNNRDSFLF